MGGTRQAGERGEGWAETRRRSRRGVGGDEKQEVRTGTHRVKTHTHRRRNFSVFYRTRSSGGGAHAKFNVIARIGCFDWPRPFRWPTSLGRKPPHFISGKATPDSEHTSLRRHDTTRIAHTEIGTRITSKSALGLDPLSSGEPTMDPRSSGEPPGPTTYPPSEPLADRGGVRSKISGNRGSHVVSGEGRYAVVNETRGQAGQRVPWLVMLHVVVDETRGKHVFRAAWASCWPCNTLL